MGDVRLLEAHRHWPDEALVLWHFSREISRHEAHFCHHALPRLLLPLATLQHFEHFGLGLGAD